MTVRAFARWRGVSHTAVQQRIAAGALPTSVKKIRGRAMIVDPQRAVEEWEAHTRPKVPTPGDGRSRAPSALARATRREREARAQLAELEYARKSRTLVPVVDVETRWTALVVAARNQLLGLPTRAKAQLPHLSGDDLSVLDRLVREALEELGSARPSASAGGDR